jgi:hypothetical protein
MTWSLSPGTPLPSDTCALDGPRTTYCKCLFQLSRAWKVRMIISKAMFLHGEPVTRPIIHFPLSHHPSSTLPHCRVAWTFLFSETTPFVTHLSLNPGWTVQCPSVSPSTAFGRHYTNLWKLRHTLQNTRLRNEMCKCTGPCSEERGASSCGRMEPSDARMAVLPAWKFRRCVFII